MTEPLRYLPFETAVDTAFWHSLAKRKLEDFRLCVGPFPLRCEYTIDLPGGLNPRVTLDVSAFPEVGLTKQLSTTCFQIEGELTALNSLDEFKSLDKQCFINEYGTKIFKRALDNNEYLKHPDVLMCFQLLTYLDLKRYKFYFWFAYPAVLHTVQPVLLSSHLIEEEFSDVQLTQLMKSYDKWRKNHTSSFFLATILSSNSSDLDVLVSSCSDFQIGAPNVYLGFCDPSTDSKFPGWPLRNLLFAISASLVKKREMVKVICLRDRYSRGQRQFQHSLVLNVELNHVDPSSISQFVGWEKNSGDLKPKYVNLSSSMDPIKLAESAVDLNLRLMKWRLMPDLKLDVFRDIKCLLIGAGTLGCNVARQLMAWGIRYITFIDNSNVSLSNPVRQSLYFFEDSHGERKPKAIVAAEALKRIFPGVCAKGIELNVPMPGHPVSPLVRSKTNEPLCIPKKLDEPKEKHLNLPQPILEAYLACAKLNDLIKAHDVVFLMTDTRESRWLPTLLSNCEEKLVINAALGFDTFLVMRHGLSNRTQISNKKLWKEITLSDKQVSHITENQNYVHPHQSIPGYQLGCYFCSDVVGPANSVQNRSLDQQCTVTRPGVSMIAGAFAVELLISVLQHPLGANAAACTNSDSTFDSFSFNSHSFNLVPHQIRGFLSHFNQMVPATSAFTNCSACSSYVTNAFLTDGFKFLLQVFDDPNYLEEVAGLKEIHRVTENNDVIAFSDSESDQ